MHPEDEEMRRRRDSLKKLREELEKVKETRKIERARIEGFREAIKSMLSSYKGVNEIIDPFFETFLIIGDRLNENWESIQELQLFTMEMSDYFEWQIKLIEDRFLEKMR